MRQIGHPFALRSMIQAICDKIYCNNLQYFALMSGNQLPYSSQDILFIKCCLGKRQRPKKCFERTDLTSGLSVWSDKDVKDNHY